MENYRDINWAVSFEITVNGEEKEFWQLSESEQKEIAYAILQDSYSGTFLGDIEEIEDKEND